MIHWQFQFALNDNKHIAIRNSCRTAMMLNMKTKNMFIMILHILLNQRLALVLLDFGEWDWCLLQISPAAPNV
jgi:hypothetical protein